MAGGDDFEELRRAASRRARIAEGLAKGRAAFRTLRFREAMASFQDVLEVDPENVAARRLLSRARLAVRVRPFAFVVGVALLGWVGFMIATDWGPALWTREPPVPTATRPPTATPTARPATRTPTATRTRIPSATPQPTVTPTPVDLRIEVLNARVSGQRALIEFKVYKSGENVVGLLKSDFGLRTTQNDIPFSFQERDADDPVCVVVAVDNSGSILPGLEQIRSAVRSLSDMRKPGDELGLVLFAEPSRVEVKQEPSQSPLDEAVVTGVGELTALWDGVLLGLEQTQACTIETRYLIVLTDGADTGSIRLPGDDTDRAVALATRAEQENVDICTVGVESEALKEEPLRRVAYGCRYQRASRFDDLVAMFQELFGSVRHFYRVEFDVGEIPSDASAVTLRVLDAVDARVEFQR